MAALCHAEALGNHDDRQMSEDAVEGEEATLLTSVRVVEKWGCRPSTCRGRGRGVGSNKMDAIDQGI